jgi:SIR2-like domain
MTAVEQSSPFLADIGDAVRRGECILFLGAGVHCPPPPHSRYVYPEATRPPMGSRFSVDLAKECAMLEGRDESPKNLQRISLFYEAQWGRNKLVSQVERAVQTGKEPSPALRALAELDFPLVITTNYDRLFERALFAAKKQPFVSVYSRERDTAKDYPRPTPTAEEPFIFKIHGDIGDLASLVITDEDYIQFVRRMSESGPYDPVPMTFLYFFKKWPTLFVGYSLVDYNLRLLFKTLRWRIDQAIVPDTYSVDLYPDPLIVDVWERRERYVKFIVEDVWEFVPALYRLVKAEEMPD